MFNEKETHPSYGTIVFNRARANGTTLFGSNIKHDEIVTMEVSHASLERGLHQDWVHDEGTILSIEMSYAQFAQAISSFGMYPGVPCTIRRTEKDGFIEERPTYKNKRKELDQELKDKMDEFTRLTNGAYTQAQSILNKKGSITKDDKKEILSIIQQIAHAMPDTEYLYNCMSKEMDKTVLEAKNEIEAFAQHRIESIANATIAESSNPVKLLSGLEDDTDE